MYTDGEGKWVNLNASEATCETDFGLVTCGFGLRSGLAGKKDLRWCGACPIVAVSPLTSRFEGTAGEGTYRGTYGVGHSGADHPRSDLRGGRRHAWPMPTTPLWTPKQVREYLHISPATLYRYIAADPTFPPRIHLSQRTVRFRSDLVVAWATGAEPTKRRRRPVAL